ncbi:mannitol/fructose-specific phosphotransferase system IIA component (Ntr-type)/predicted DNA-binding protein YlxM (UPF0122 family) [Lactobacillus colini]|uniref:Mannitol/fructose-specific phosphotransferase system IIA component (Ntr-type)/predicted DNA-binding protein YlxM (UPF0122 family) n=1 Tax=Lactobacillus colini TaxID=1819254 RepID=A0ABS4MFL6_9LACO|nr:PTS sugar transporter subunit IIA [Lactobacillus colini]MBP2058478.1 mannitol/fructose-specific phosphotransferase system IIA component (Ntr-type)/predicted DNA-binding protein YlxM (UPF0122 family) [Lactobacillus colini]
MLSERQNQIINLLKNSDISVHNISKKLGVSDKTITREIKAINDEISKYAYINICEGQLHLNIISSIGFYQHIEQIVPVEIRLLYLVLINESISLDECADMLYITKSKIKEYIFELNNKLRSKLSIELKQGIGIVVNCPLKTKIDLVTNIIFDYKVIEYNNYKVNFFETIFIQDYYNFAAKYIDHKALECQILACKMLNVSLDSQKQYFKEKKLSLEKFESNESKIKADIIKSFLKNGLDIPNDKILNMCLAHIEREILFSVILLKNKANIKNYLKVQPIAFDIAKKISNMLFQNYDIDVNAYYISLYVMLVLSTTDDSIYKIILISRRKSVSSINKYLIEAKIDGSKVSVIDNSDALSELSYDYTVVLDSELVNEIKLPEIDLIISDLVAERDIKKLKSIVRKKTFSNLIDDTHKNYTFSINNNSSDFFLALTDFLTMLTNKELINDKEIKAIINREDAGNQLIIGDYSIPHIISNSNKNFQLFLANLKTPVVVEKQFIDKILIVIISTRVSNKSEIFKYLFEIINPE